MPQLSLKLTAIVNVTPTHFDQQLQLPGSGVRINWTRVDQGVGILHHGVHDVCCCCLILLPCNCCNPWKAFYFLQLHLNLLNIFTILTHSSTDIFIIASSTGVQLVARTFRFAMDTLITCPKFLISCIALSMFLVFTSTSKML